jgi:coenzyme Q-binding protein COQ10
VYKGGEEDVPEVVKTQEILAPPERVWSILERMEEFPEYMDSVERVTVVERGEGYTITEWVTHLEGRPFRWREMDRFLPEEGRLEYHLTEGDLRRFEGHWQVEPMDQGRACRVTLRVYFDFGVPMLAAMLNPVARVVLGRNVTSMLEGLKAKAEASNLPERESVRKS